MERETAWWAIISEPVKEQFAISSPHKPSSFNERLEAGANIPDEMASSVATGQQAWQQLQLNGGYLDADKRYRLEPEKANSDIQSVQLHSSMLWFQTRVIDHYPLHQPVLEEQLDRLEELLEQNMEASLADEGIPHIALPYLNLQELVPTIPEVHNAWQDGDREVVLLADRSHWQLLSVWAQEPLPWLQMLHYLAEMVHLWQHLGEVNCCQSLLEETNLRIDEDQILGLQQLYRDPLDDQPHLLSLVQAWQGIFQQAGRTEQDFLQLLSEKVASGEIQTAQQLKNYLQDLVHHQQANDTSETGEDDSGDTIIEAFDIYEGELPTVVLPMELRRLDDFGATNIGRQRTQNEDSFSISTQVSKHSDNRGQKLLVRGLYIICDGMGGHARGEIASATAVETLQRYFNEHWEDQLPDRETIQEGILLANQAIHSVNLQLACTGNERMGTTLAMALVQNTQVAIAHVGDSRIYRATRKGVEQLSLDHAVAQQDILRGVEPDIAYARPDAYYLTQALGPCANEMVKPDIQFLNIRENTLFLLCSDGFSDNNFLPAQEQHVISLTSSRADLEQGLLSLIELANQHNGHDNITSIVIRMQVKPNLETQSLI